MTNKLRNYINNRANSPSAFSYEVPGITKNKINVNDEQPLSDEELYWQPTAKFINTLIAVR